MLVVVAGVSTWRLLRQQEPVYGGKTLTAWLRTYDPSSSSQLHSKEWNDADDAVRHMGTNCLPTLLRMIRAKDSPAKLWLVALVKKQGLGKKIHFVPATMRNIEASRAFIALGAVGKDAVPALMAMYDNHLTTESRSAIEDALAWIGPAAKPAIPLLLGAATNSNPKLRADALWALGEIHAEPGICVPCLIHALDDPNDEARLSAAHALGRFGAEAKPAVPCLTKLASVVSVQNRGVLSGRVGVMIEAKNALRKIDPPLATPDGGTFFGSENALGNPPVFPQ